MASATVFTNEFLDTVDQGLPLAQMTQAYDGTSALSLINRMLALDLKYTLADNDLPKVIRSWRIENPSNPHCILNGIAYNAQADTLVLTGKCWKNYFEVRFPA